VRTLHLWWARPTIFLISISPKRRRGEMEIRSLAAHNLILSPTLPSNHHYPQALGDAGFPAWGGRPAPSVSENLVVLNSLLIPQGNGKPLHFQECGHQAEAAGEHHISQGSREDPGPGAAGVR